MNFYSIIIPVFNAATTIDRCLDSILSNKIQNLEIILIDDGSTDNSLEICYKYQELDKRIKILSQENSGPSIARNNGIKKAFGQYVIFVDADDYISSDFFEVIDKYMVDDIDVLKFNIEYHGDRVHKDIFNTAPFKVMTGEHAIEMFIDSGKIFATPWMYVFKKRLFIENELFFSERHIHEDYGLIPCLLIKSKRIAGIDYVGYNYVYRHGSLSTNQSYDAKAKRAFDMLIHYDYLNEFAINNIESKTILSKFKNYISENLIKKVEVLKGDKLLEFISELRVRGIEDFYEK